MPEGYDAPCFEKWNADDEYRAIAEAPVGETVWQYDPAQIELWDLGKPNLYMLRTQLVRDGVVLDTKETRIGFRTLRVLGDRFECNGRIMNLRCDSWHYMGYTVQDPAYAEALYRMELEANVNIVRLHAQPWPEFYLDKADEVGMLICDESAVWASHCRFGYTDELFERAQKHMGRLILRDRNHPSVVFWNTENECVMALKAGNSPMIESIAACEDKLWNYMQACRKYDDSRIFGGDGSWDLRGRAPICSFHYPTEEQPIATKVPSVIGEMGAMYYATPDTLTADFGEEALLSADGRLVAVSESARDMLAFQRKWAAQVCVFNLQWYGLRPIAYEERSLPGKPEGTPGIDPARVVPYQRPINAGLDPHQPEYLPNPVWDIVADAYVPTRFFLMDPPYAAYSGEAAEFSIRIFNDGDAEGEFELNIGWEGGKCQKKLRLTLADCVDTVMNVPAGEAGERLLHITLEKDGVIYYSRFFTLTVYDKQELLGRIAALHVPVITEGEVPQGAFIDLRKETLTALRRSRTQRTVYDTERIRFNGPVDFDSFAPPVPVNGRPVLYTGDGEPVALLNGNAVVCGLPLTDETQPQMLALRLRLSEMAAEGTRPLPVGVDAYGIDDSFAAMLNVLGVDCNVLTRQQLAEKLMRRQDNVLVVKGEVPSQVSRCNYEKVIVLDADKPPVSLCNSFRRVEMRSFHLMRKARDLGLYSNNLYGLTSGRENILANGMLMLMNGELENLLGQPDVDWRVFGAEAYKTVSLIRDTADNSLLSALAEGHQAGSCLWFTTLSSQNTPQLRHIWARLLDVLGVALDPGDAEGLHMLFTGGVYGDGTAKLLYYPGMKAEDALPGLNKWQDGGWWRAVRGGTKSAGCYAVFLNSPQDRTDLLANPDTLDLLVEAEQPVRCLLNGTDMGTEKVLNSAPLKAGWNLLLLETENEGEVPVVRIRRTNGKPNDVTFSLMDDVRPVDMEQAVYTASHNNAAAAMAACGTGKYWTTGEFQSQMPGMWFNVELPEAVPVSALCFSGRGAENRQDTNMPDNLSLWVGEDADHLTCIAKGASAVRMIYQDGAEQLKCFLSFPRQQAKCIRMQIDAILLDRGWSMQDLQLFG